MTPGPPVALAPLLLEDDHLRAAHGAHQGGLDRGALDGRRADLGLALAANHQNALELDSVFDVTEELDVENVSLAHPVLLATCFDNRKHLCTLLPTPAIRA